MYHVVTSFASLSYTKLQLSQHLLEHDANVIGLGTTRQRHDAESSPVFEVVSAVSTHHNSLLAHTTRPQWLHPITRVCSYYNSPDSRRDCRLSRGADSSLRHGLVVRSCLRRNRTFVQSTVTTYRHRPSKVATWMNSISSNRIVSFAYA